MGEGDHLWGILTLNRRSETANRHPGHDIRGVLTTWASLASVPFKEIMDAAVWSHPQTITQFYLKDLPATKGGFIRAVLVTAGTASKIQFHSL